MKVAIRNGKEPWRLEGAPQYMHGPYIVASLPTANLKISLRPRTFDSLERQATQLHTSCRQITLPSRCLHKYPTSRASSTLCQSPLPLYFRRRLTTIGRCDRQLRWNLVIKTEQQREKHMLMMFCVYSDARQEEQEDECDKVQGPMQEAPLHPYR